MRHQNLAIADIVNCYNSLLDDYDYRPIAVVDRVNLDKAARTLSKQDFIIPDWRVLGALPQNHPYAFVSHTFYINAINFGFRNIATDENYRFNFLHHGSLGAAACFYRFGERPIHPQDIFKITESLDAMREFFRGENEMPMLAERRDILWKAARMIEEGFDGSPMNIIEEGQYSAEKIIGLLINSFPLAYGSDYVFYERPDGKRTALFFNKRAQLWPLVYHGRACYSFDALPELRDPEYIGAISDPAVPNALRELAVLFYGDELVKMTARRIPLESGGKIEVELRMATVYAAQKLLELINYHRRPRSPITMVELDFYLWTLGRQSKLPRHLCQTTAY